MTKFSLTERQRGYLMRVGSVAVGLNMPKALSTLSLPPYHRRRSFLVDEYPGCPKEWLRSKGRLKSYFVPIVEGNGLWLDFNGALEKTMQHVAVVVSIQGINPITGLATAWPPQLEQFKDKCPKHKTDFGPDRLCKECGHKWPKQNYVSSTGTPEGMFWLDGFRSDDGQVRRYILTAETVRSVAKAIVGEERAFAIGLSFWVSKTQRPAPPAPPRDEHLYLSSSEHLCSAGPVYGASAGGMCSAGPIGADTVSGDVVTSWGLVDKSSTAGEEKYSSGPPAMKSGPVGAKGMSGTLGDRSRHLRAASASVNYTAFADSGKKSFFSPAPVEGVKKMEIGAGDLLDQQIWDDPNGLDFWQPEPEGLIVVNYVTEEDCNRILAAGQVDLSGNPEGFLKDVPVVGNPK